MHLVIEVDSEIEVIEFDWAFRYEIVLNIRDCDTWHIILYVYDEEWRDIEMPSDNDLPNDVFWFCLCTDEEFDELI